MIHFDIAAAIRNPRQTADYFKASMIVARYHRNLVLGGETDVKASRATAAAFGINLAQAVTAIRKHN